MLRGIWHGEPLGSGTDSWKYWAELRAGNITEDEWDEVESGIARSPGRMTMGTASTMTSAAEALGMTLPGAASIPAADSDHIRMASASGRRIVDMVWEDLKPREILTEKAFEKCGHDDHGARRLDQLCYSPSRCRTAGECRYRPVVVRCPVSRHACVIADIRPSGRYLMEDFYYAGGLRGLPTRLSAKLHLDAVTANGKTLGENLEGAKVYNDEVIRSLDNTMSEEGGLVVLKGILAPDGAVIKHTAAEPQLHQHKGPAVVFKNYNDMSMRIDDANLDITKDSVIVLQNAGPVGGPGHARMGPAADSAETTEGRRARHGPHFGRKDEWHVLRCLRSARSARVLYRRDPGAGPRRRYGGVGHPGRRLHLDVSDEELARRKAEWDAPKPHYPRGYGWMYAQHIGQANEGCDFDFLEAGDEDVPEPEIH